MDKKFFEWMKLKERLHKKEINVPYVNQGDVWWISIGHNIGWEVNGKNQEFSRPVIILKKLANGFYFVIPVSSQLKRGTWYVPFRHQGKNMVACLQQARSIDFRRLSAKMGRLDDADFSRIKSGLFSLLS